MKYYFNQQRFYSVMKEETIKNESSPKSLTGRVNIMQKIFLFFAVFCISVSGCIKEKPDDYVTINGTVTFNGTPVQSAKVSLWIGSIGNPVQTVFTDSEGRYEIVAITDGTLVEGRSGYYFRLYVDWNNRRYYCPDFYSLVQGYNHMVNIPLDKW